MRTEAQRIIDGIREKVEVLTGERAGGARRAIRPPDLDALRTVKLNAKYAAGTYPTAAEFKALVDDVREIVRILSAIS